MAFVLPLLTWGISLSRISFRQLQSHRCYSSLLFKQPSIDILTILNLIANEDKLPYLYPMELPKDPRILRVAILGPANAGKSTLVNKIVGGKVEFF